MALALLLALLPGARTSSRSQHAVFQITGYASDWTPPSTIDTQASAISNVGIDGVGVSPSGSSIGPPSARSLALLAVAHAHGLRSTLLVGNWGGPSGVSPGIASRLLTSGPHRAHVVYRLLQIVRTEGWDGVTLDLESLSSSDGPGLVALATALRSRLPRGDLLAVDVAAPQSIAGDIAEGYRLPSLGRVADVVLMAYDEHGPWSGPGPIGGLPWLKRVLNVARNQIPSQRLILGMAAYGYSWRVGKHPTSAAVTDVQALRLLLRDRSHPRWNAVQGEWTAALRHRTVLWWSNSRSIRLRETLARRLHLGGVAIWQLASADALHAR